MTTETVTVKLNALARVYGNDASAAVRAVDNVSLEFLRGTLTLLMGPSGSGKTTLLSLIGGLLAPTSGTVAINDIRLDTLTPSALTEFRLRHVGFVYQRFRLLDALSAIENIELPLTLAGVHRPESRRVANSLAKQVGLNNRLLSSARTLSGGEQQRVAIARALANSPPVLLADEPTGSLDSVAGQRIIELLRATATGGVSVVVASHDMRLLPFADTVVRMEDGRVVGIVRQ